MNPLESYLKTNNLDPMTTMNRLQDAGIVSDNCVTPRDVAEADCGRAVDYLRG